MGVTYCPGLYRVGNKFMCKFTESEVNPALLPCVSDYTTCPVYIRAMRAKKAEEISKKEEVVEEVSETAPIVTEAISPVEDIFSKLASIERDLMKLNSHWASYESATKELLKRWAETREDVLKRLSSIDQVIQSLMNEKKELEVWKEMGLISDEYYERETKELEDKVSKLEDERSKLVNYLEKIEEATDSHLKRIIVASARAEISKLKLSLAKLDQLFERGEIDRETYERVRSEIESKIKKLERLL